MVQSVHVLPNPRIDFIAAWQSATQTSNSVRYLLRSCSPPKKDLAENKQFRPLSHDVGGAMAFAQDCGSGQSSVALRTSDRLTVGLIAMGVIFASLGLGEAVYRFAFFDFNGATDRLPIELLFGLAFAWITTK